MISVVIAAYDGAQYIGEQLDSVLSQLTADDEIIISDDKPDGSTISVVREYLTQNARIHYMHGPGEGVIRNFEHAIQAAQGDYIFLCDQDDVWLPDKVRVVTQALQNGAMVVLHDAIMTDEALRPVEDSFFRARGSHTGIARNIIKNSYIGCCMAFRKELKPYILPFPENLPMHDQWIGLMGERVGSVQMINRPLLYYRRHDGAVTGGKTTLRQKITWRADIIKALWRKQVK